MTKVSATPTVDRIIVFIGIFSLILGVFSGLRIGVNHWLFPKYPTSGVLQVASYPVYGQREEDCTFKTPYFGMDGKARSATPEEQQMETEQQQRCLDSVTEVRKASLIQDIGTAAFFLFVGTAVLLSKKLFLR